MSLTINGATNTITGAAGLAIAANTAVTGTLSATGILTRISNAGTDGYLVHLTTGINNQVVGFNNSGSTNANGVLNNTGYIGSLNAYGTSVIGNGAVIGTFTSSAQGDLGIYSNGVLRAASTAASGSPVFSGNQSSLAVAGGGAIAGSLYVGGTSRFGTAASTTTGLSVIDTLDASSTTAASLKTAGGLAVAKKTYCGDNIVMASGKGIDFSATANGTGTTTSEVLSDYEEGTFTAAWEGTTAAPTTPVTTTAYYTKTGDCVYVSIVFPSSNLTGATGNIKVTGLPFTTRAGGGLATPLGSMILTGHTTTAPVAWCAASGTTILPLEAATDAYIAISAGASKSMRLAFTYFV
jgi:hypothetical protein